MTLSATTNKIAYPGPGGTVFMANFPAVQASDVEVYKTDQTTGLVVGSALVNVTDYTLTGLGGTGFTVTLTADLGAYGLLIRRIEPLTMGTNLPDEGNLRPTSIQAALDKLARIAVQLQEQLTRSLHMPITSTGTSTSNEIPEQTSDGTILGKVSGRFVWLAAATAQLAADLLSAASGAKGAALVWFDKTLTYTAGSVGAFLNDLGTAATTKGAALIGYLAPYTHAVARTLQSWMNDSVNAATWGLVGDGVTDNTAAWANCLTDCAGKTIHVNPGTYITAPFTVPDNTTIIGAGMRTTTFKMKAASNGNLLSNVGASGSNVVLEKLTLDGNNGANTSGRVLYFVTNNASDGPALVMRDVEMTFAPAGLSDSSSAFVSGLAWVHWDNVRFVNNTGTLWLSTNDSTFHALYLGNSGVAANVPGLVVGGASNKFMSCYFGGNGAATGSTASQVKIIGGQHNYFIACVNDSANGHGYEFIDNGAVYCLRNQIIGGVISNPSQNTTNTSYHVLFSGNSGYNQIIGAAFFNDLTKVGKFAIAEVASANHNLIQGCYMGAFGTGALATIGANGTHVLDCPGLTPQGIVNITPGASPYTYTNLDCVREAVYITGGTVSNISKNSVGLAASTPLTVWLEPGESLTVTYTVAPTMNADRK